MLHPLDVRRFTDEQLELIELELEAELAEVQRMVEELDGDELERRGIALRRLRVADLTSGLAGSVVAVLEPSRGGELPAHHFGTGDVVVLRPSVGVAEGADVGGVVARVGRSSLHVVLNDDEAELPSLVRAIRVTPDVTFRRMRGALEALRDPSRAAGAELRRVVLQERGPGVAREPALESIRWLDESLDHSQREAVSYALRALHLALIWGPPGTGKTTAVVEVIRQAVRRGEKTLVCAPSNVAVDNVVERLVGTEVAVVRIGHPARVLEAVRAHTLDVMVADKEDKRVARELHRELGALHRQLQRDDRRARQETRGQIKALRRELRDLEMAAVRGVLGAADVIACTTTGAADPVLEDRTFDLVVLDEAAQALEAASWIPLLRGRRAVLAGDHCQLPPTVKSMAAEERGLRRTMFERLADAFGEDVTRMLTVQYRMHETIMRWSSTAMYEGRLEAADAVRVHRLADLPGVVATADTTAPLLLLDTAGCGCDETVTGDDRSKSNPDEAAIAVRHVVALLGAGLRPDQVGVITPYNAQVQLLRELLHEHEGLEIGSVDGFQGREKEAIVLSLVRSNDRGEVGFLAESRRLNVAVTRARRHVAVIGDSATLSADPFLAGLLDHCHEHGEYRSAWDYR